MTLSLCYDDVAECYKVVAVNKSIMTYCNIKVLCNVV